MAQDEIESLLAFLPPLPWHANGNKIIAGSQPIGFIVAKNASFVANTLARLVSRYADVERELVDLRRQLEAAEEELSAYKDGTHSVASVSR